MTENEEQSYEDFISTVSHELRTPLTSIRGFSQTMLSSWDKLDDASKKKFIKIIEEQSQRLIHLVENMLAVTKLQQKNTIVFNETEVKPIVAQVVSILKNQYPSQKFIINCPDNIPKIFVDNDRFVQIMTNLIENSAKYSSLDNTSIIDVIYDNDVVVIKVSNIGLHIDPKDYSKIFTKFARIDNPLTRKVQGSGLGLYITKNLVEKMSGSIDVESKPIDENNSQITFCLKFPVKNLEEQARIKCNL